MRPEIERDKGLVLGENLSAAGICCALPYVQSCILAPDLGSKGILVATLVETCHPQAAVPGASARCQCFLWHLVGLLLPMDQVPCTVVHLKHLQILSHCERAVLGCAVLR